MYKDKKVWAVITAAGHSRRMGFDKMTYPIDNVPVIRRTAENFARNGYIDSIIITASDNRDEIKKAVAGIEKVDRIVKGGATRAISVLNAINTIEGEGLVAVQDGARPFTSQAVIDSAVRAAYIHKAAIPVVPVKDTIKISDNGFADKTLPRDKLVAVQTPQVFDVFLYKEVAGKYFDDTVTDDASLFEKAGIKIALTQGEYENYKITTPDDIKKENKMRIGHGYDVHKLTEGRKLIMGGVDIPYERGLLGHSDADVVLHAIMDSVLGALALGDIGKHFPDNNPKYSGADSMMLTKAVADMLFDKGGKIENIDVTILCQKPKLAPHIPAMRENIASCFGCDISRISVKATTEEGLGFTGEGLGIACHRVCLISGEI